jgi:hypothetical protein
MDLKKDILKRLETICLRSIMIDFFGKDWDNMVLNKKTGESDSTRYAIMYSKKTNDIFCLGYATVDNDWAIITEKENGWILICYLSPYDFLLKKEYEIILEKIELKFDLIYI